MTWRRMLLSLASAILGFLLIVALIKISRINWRATLLQIRSVSWVAFGVLVFLNALLIYLSTLKWRSIDAVLRRPSDSIPSRSASFAITSIGMAIGLVFPVQVGMTIARTLGTYVHGGAFRRGTAGTLFEQSFDVVIVFFLAIASGLTWITKGASLVWFGSAAALTLLALTLAGPLTNLLGKFAASKTIQKTDPDKIIGRVLRGLSELGKSELLNVGLARRLIFLSTLRFGVVVLMTAQTARMIGATIPLWQFAAATPLVAVATVVTITPGGIGVNELTFVTALKLFGTPISVAADWALANRVLAAAACFVLASCAAVLLISKQANHSKAQVQRATAKVAKL
jgi:uncharacterized membrane protein YbhN (UPF0104 family)